MILILNNPKIYPFILITLSVLHLEISGKDNKDEQLQNTAFNSLIFSVFHFDISGKYFIEEQS